MVQSFSHNIFFIQGVNGSVINATRSVLRSILPSGKRLGFGKQRIIQSLLNVMLKEKSMLPQYILAMA